jgi:uncharacterized membrane protein (UPF0127 family)
MRALVDENGKVVVERCEVARTMAARNKGLLGRKGLPQGEGLMIPKTGSIHTFFMAFPIDAVFLDKRMTVRRIARDLRPFRLAFGRNARSVLELAAGEAARVGLAEGSRLSWHDQAIPASEDGA